MAQRTYRANLSAAVFPLTMAAAGPTVIFPQNDQNYDRRVDPAGEQKNAGIPQAIFLDNVLPTADGYQSVRYIDNGSIPVSPISTVHTFFAYGEGSPQKFILYCSSDSGTSAATQNGATWYTVTGLEDFPVNASDLTWAIVRQTCYAFCSVDNVLYEVTFSGTVITFTNVTATLTPATFIVDNAIKAISSSFNYLLCLSSTKVYWSSTILETDFVTSLATGADSASPNNVYGSLRYILPTPEGFYIYGTTNVLNAQYTGNSRFPWKFTEIADSNQIEFFNSIYGGTGSPYHLAVDATGNLVQIFPDRVVPVAGDISTHLERVRKIDVLEPDNLVFGVLDDLRENTPAYPVHIYNSRYICVSWGTYKQSSIANVRQFEYILIFDTLLQRYGRLKITHTHVEDLQNRLVISDAYVGKTYWLVPDSYQRGGLLETQSYLDPNSVLVLGKFKYVRDRFLNLQEVTVDSANGGYVLRILPSMNGREFDRVVDPYLDTEFTSTDGRLKRYLLDLEAHSFALVIQGNFDVAGVDMVYALGGS